MTRWYAERRTVLGRWASQTTPEAPHGREADHIGEIVLPTNSGPLRLRRITRVPGELEEASLGQLQRQAAAGADR
jgi:hypothetical protein